MLKGIIFDFNRTLYDPEAGKLFPGVKELLKDLGGKGIKRGLISFGSLEKEQLIKSLGLPPFLDWYTVVLEKNPAHFQMFCKKFNIKPEEVAVVGDRMVEEITVGKRLGMKTMWLKRGAYANEITNISPDFIIDSLAEIPFVIDALR